MPVFVRVVVVVVVIVVGGDGVKTTMQQQRKERKENIKKSCANQVRAGKWFEIRARVVK